MYIYNIVNTARVYIYIIPQLIWGVLGSESKKEGGPDPKPNGDYLGTLTWRFIPFSKWLITMVSCRPLSGVVGPLPNGLFIAYKWGRS